MFWIAGKVEFTNRPLYVFRNASFPTATYLGIIFQTLVKHAVKSLREEKKALKERGGVVV